LAGGIQAANRIRQDVFKYLAVSTAVASVHRKAGLSADIAVIPNFIDLSENPFVPPPKIGEILYVGPWTSVKGSETLSLAHRLLIQQGRRIVLNQVGEPIGPKGDFIRRSGRLYGASLDAAFRSARIVVVPSVWSEPCPTVALEAMAAGRAVVASETGGLVDIVQNEITGKLVPPNDAKALANAIDAIFYDDEKLEAFGRAGRTAVEAFSTQTVGPQIEGVYADSVGPTSRSASARDAPRTVRSRIQRLSP
jgi:glycogen synthase